MAVAIVTGRVPMTNQKKLPHLEVCPFCGSLDLVLWDNEEEVKAERTKTRAKGGPVHLLDYCAGIYCNSCGAKVEFDYGTPDWPRFSDTVYDAREWVANSWNSRDMGITFFEFMMKYLDKDSPAGDLARDMNQDKKHFPRANTRNEIMSYLYSKGACDDCIETFLKCYKRYMRYKQRQHKKAEAEDLLARIDGHDTGHDE